jgi:hypothetical protein
LNLRRKLTKLQFFLKRTPTNIKTNAFNIHVNIHLWFAKKNIQIILNSYATTRYYTSYMKKIDESLTLELHFIVQKCIANKINANTRIQKSSYVFLNLFNLCFLYHYTIYLKHLNLDKPKVVLNQLKLYSTNIIRSSIKI